jgi:hypothetical protein
MELLKAIKEMIVANTKAMQEDMKAMADGKEQMKAQVSSLVSRLEANQAKTDVNLNEMREEIKSGQAEMRSIVSVWIAT